jgi:hypothetical protein
VPRPPRELKGFAVVRLAPGETAEVALALEDRDLAYWDVARRSWRIEPGRFEIQVGHSSRDIRLRARSSWSRAAASTARHRTSGRTPPVGPIVPSLRLPHLVTSMIPRPL